MPRKPKTIPGPSRLSGILAQLTQAPRPSLTSVKALRLTFAARNDHFGARHFAKEDLPRIRYANPAIEIEVNKVQPSERPGTFKPELIVERRDGNSHSIALDNKWSSTILAELLDVAGSASWDRWKAERAAQGLPVFNDFGRVPIQRTGAPPKKKAPPRVVQAEATAPEITPAAERDIERARSSSGAAAILP